MASKMVVDAVRTRLAALWTACPVFDPGSIEETPSDGSPYLEVQYPVANEEQITVGAPGAQLHREEGGIRFLLAVERGRGIDQGLAWIDQLRALFRGQQFGGVNCLGASPAFQDNGNESGNYALLTSVVLYYADITG